MPKPEGVTAPPVTVRTPQPAPDAPAKPTPKPPGDRWQLRAVLRNGKSSIVVEDFADTADLDERIARVWAAPVRVGTKEGFSFYPPSVIARVDVVRIDGD